MDTKIAGALGGASRSRKKREAGRINAARALKVRMERRRMSAGIPAEVGLEQAGIAENSIDENAK
jgi:hypothetical protein